MTPEEIVTGFRDNNRDTMVYVFNKLVPNVRSLLAKDKAVHLAKDLTWESIAIFWEKCQNPDFDIESSPLAYMYRICRNKWIDRLKIKEQLVEDPMLLPYIPYDPIEDYPDLWELVEKHLQTMRKTCRDILVLLRETDDYGKIAQQLDISYENARHRKSVCLSELIKNIKNNRDNIL